ncbi:MAG: hypothetical protein FD181_2574 [Prolixibacteraceae bacterium]|nr:MAG: hypothetical protein FD181_2574 [Prolixibacteraceae bacterium]
MKQIYSKPTRELLKEFILVHNISRNQIIQKDDIKNWFHLYYPNIKKNTVYDHIVQATTNYPTRFHYSPALDGRHDLFFQLDDGTLRLYDKANDPTPIYKKGEKLNEVLNSEDFIESDTDDSGQEFAFEKDLLSFLCKNLHTIEPGLVLYKSDGISGIEFNAGGRFIDILAVDKNNCFVVIELKVSKGSDRVIGQLLRYVGWVKSNLAMHNQKVRGVIIARNISEDLKIACSVVQDVKLFEYNISFTLKAV